MADQCIPQLQAFNDAWMIFSEFHDVLENLAALAGQNPLPETIIEALREKGFEDKTEKTKEDPNPWEKAE